MKYKSYMDAFTLGDEAKSAIFNKIKQSENSVTTESAEHPTPIFVPAAAAKRKNAIALHPKRWVAIATSLVLIAVLTPVIYFSVPKNTGIDKFTDTDNPTVSLSLDYMENLMIDTEGITAYSIRKVTDASNDSASVKTQNSASVSLLSSMLADTDDDEIPPPHFNRYYLYSTSETYENGNVEYDSNGIQKVTFKKNTEVTEEIYDDNGELIDSSRKITQEELDGQINKIYTTKEYTFIQFVAMVESSGDYPYKTADGETEYEHVELRPESIHYDYQGVADFDKTDYYSSNLTASFVIDNSTGYIYKIENIHISEFINGLIKDDNGYYYSVSTDSEHNLLFTDILPNKDIDVYNVFMDGYGWIYVLNSAVNETDYQRKVIYCKDDTYSVNYLYDSDKNVYMVDDYRTHYRTHLTKKMVNGEPVDFKNNVIIRGLKPFCSDRCYLPDSDNYLIGMYYDLGVYRRYMLAFNHETYCGFDASASEYYWFDDNYDTIIAIYDGRLYYKQINLNNYRKDYTFFEEKDFTKLSDISLQAAENYEMQIGNDTYMINDVYYHIGVDEKSYYKLVRATTGLELVELTSYSYTENVFIFQPINK